MNTEQREAVIYALRIISCQQCPLRTMCEKKQCLMELAANEIEENGKEKTDGND